MEKTVKRSQQESAEFSLLLIHSPQGFLLQQMDEKILGQVLCILPTVATSTNEGVNRQGVTLVKISDGSAGRGTGSRIFARGYGELLPACCGEVSPLPGDR